MLETLRQKWILVEIDHRVSKAASDAFWRLANDSIHEMYVAKGRGRKIPQMPHLRAQLYDDNTPRVNMDVAYESKDTGEITILKDVDQIPVSRFPPSHYRKLFEIASVDVSNG